MVFTKKNEPSNKGQDYSIASHYPTNDQKKTPFKTTRIIIHCNCGFKNNIFIRGQGAGLSWEKGIMLKNLGPDLWQWETDKAINFLEFKVLINDTHYELGENHVLTKEGTAEFTPRF